MTEMKVFELKGESAVAAFLLEQEVLAQLRQTQVQQTGNLGDIHESWRKMYAEMMTRLKKDRSDLLEMTGLNSPATQVVHVKDALPRAYVEYPAIFASPEKKPRYFMYAPVDYKGNYFKPKDAALLSKEEEERANSLLFAGGWLGNAPIVSMPKTGVATPADYKKPRGRLKDAFGQDMKGYRCFVAGGVSLNAVMDLERRTADYSAAVSAFFDAARQATETLFPDIRRAQGMPEDAELNVSMMYGDHMAGENHTGLELCVRQRLGEIVPTPENPHYHLVEKGRNTHVALRTDTPEGRALKAVFDRIPFSGRPHIGEYSELHAPFRLDADKYEKMLGVSGAVPSVWKLQGLQVLAYRVSDDDRSDFCPPGATPLPTEAYLWLKADESDLAIGTTPPPMPPAIAKAVRRIAKAQKTSPKL